MCVYVAKITVVLPAPMATPVNQTKPPVHHAHHPVHRLRVRPVNLIVISRPEPPVRTVLARINTHLIVITSKIRRGICPVSFILPLLYPLNHLGSWKYPPHVHAVHRVLVSKPHSPKRQHHRHYQISPYSSVRWGHNKHRPGPKRD